MCTEFAFTDFLLVPRDGSLVDGDGEIDDIVIEGTFAVTKEKTYVNFNRKVRVGIVGNC
jgi:hypothetical protein